MYIVRGQTNKTPLTLNEKRQEENSEFIIKFTNELTKEYKVVGVTDISEYTERSNIFNITEGDTENLQHSVVKLYPSGKWSYTVYEMAQSSPRNLDPDDAIKIVQSGLCEVYQASDHEVKVFSEEDNETSPSFNES